MLLLLLGALGCGYTAGYRLPAGVFDLAVPVFENQTFPLRREIEYDLTGAVRRALELRSDARLVASAKSDAVLEGTILSFQEGVLTEGRQDMVQESSVSLRVRIRLVRTRDRSVILDRVISDTATFSVLRNETLDEAQREAIDQVAKRIVSELEPRN